LDDINFNKNLNMSKCFVHNPPIGTFSASDLCVRACVFMCVQATDRKERIVNTYVHYQRLDNLALRLNLQLHINGPFRECTSKRHLDSHLGLLIQNCGTFVPLILFSKMKTKLFETGMLQMNVFS